VDITEVRVKLMEEAGERLQAFCSITFDDDFVVRDLKIIEGTTGPFVAMPSRKLTAHCGHCGSKNHLRASYCNQCGGRLKDQSAAKDDDGRAKLYADIAHPINAACREMIQQRVIKAYEEEKARSRLPGYVPTYEDFDDDTAWTPPTNGAPASEHPAAPAIAPRLQGAEMPRGPHRPPTAPQRAPRSSESRAGDSFGAGVFD